MYADFLKHFFGILLIGNERATLNWHIWTDYYYAYFSSTDIISDLLLVKQKLDLVQKPDDNIWCQH